MKTLLSFFFALLFITAAFCQKKPAGKPALQVVCTEHYEAPPENLQDSVYIQKCIWGNYRFVTVGTPDYKGRYFNRYIILKNNRTGQDTLKNSDLLISNYKPLEAMLNKKLKGRLLKTSASADFKECFEGVSYKYFFIDSLGMAIKENADFEFIAEYDLISACNATAGDYITIPYAEMKPYLKAP